MSWAKDLWSKNKLLFCLLIPLILLVVFKDLIMDYLIGSSRKLVNKTKEEDQKLKAESDKAQQEANDLKESADNKEEQINNLPEDEDWHKRIK